MPGFENLSREELAFEVGRGARFVVFQYCISVLVMTFRRPTGVQLVRAGESALVKGLPYTGLTLLLGWWGFPWGLFYTPQIIFRNLKGGTDVTTSMLQRLQIPLPAPTQPPAIG